MQWIEPYCFLKNIINLFKNSTLILCLLPQFKLSFIPPKLH